MAAGARAPCQKEKAAYSMSNSKAGEQFREGHRGRMRLRLLENPRGLAEYEVLECLLHLGIPRKDTRPLAHALLRRFGSMRGVLNAQPEELGAVEGIGRGCLAMFGLMREVMSRYGESALPEREVLSSFEAVARMVWPRLMALRTEECWLAQVDAGNRLMSWQKLRDGSVSAVHIEPGDILRAALLGRSSGIILAHNHPGGKPDPSRADLELTSELQNLAPRLGLRFLDHVIVTEDSCYSISQSKLLRLAGGKNGRRN